MSATLIEYAPLAGADATSGAPVASYLPGAPYAYADPTVAQVFGPVYLPRIHALGLDTLELASSGNVAITLGDTCALDLGRTLTPLALTTLRAAQPSDGIQLTTSDGAASVAVLPSGIVSLVSTTTASATIGGCNVLNVLPDRVHINGNLVVSGVYTTYQTTRLNVDDTVIVLARSSNGPALGVDEAIGACGMIVDTLPAAGATPNAAKSLLWNNGAAGTAGLLQGDATAATESYWELRGGQLRITSTDSNGHDVSFALRLGGDGGSRLEVVQSWFSPTLGARVSRRVGSFGGPML
jgi:hypothetical protein